MCEYADVIAFIHHLLLAGEQVVLSIPFVEVAEGIQNSWVPGCLICTNYRFVFVPQATNQVSTKKNVNEALSPSRAVLLSSGTEIMYDRFRTPIPYGMVFLLEKVGGKKMASQARRSYLVTLFTKDLRRFRISFNPAERFRREFFATVKRYVTLSSSEPTLFYFSHQKEILAAQQAQQQQMQQQTAESQQPPQPPHDVQLMSVEEIRNIKPRHRSQAIALKLEPAVVADTSSGSRRRASQIEGQTSAQISVDGWNLFSPRAEFERQGIVFISKQEMENSGAARNMWRISTVNQDFSFCETYPRLICVPAHISDEQVRAVGEFRSKSRIPTLSFFNSRTGMTLTRSSQPRIGLTNKSSIEDERYIEAIRQASFVGNNPLIIVDLRPRVNAEANKMSGGGYEDTSGGHYRHCSHRFFPIQNIHVIKKSFIRLMNLCMETGGVNEKWLSRLEATGWLVHIRSILIASCAVADVLENEMCPVLAHCSDGWDRTSQVTALAQIMLDPYFRTIKGFAVLLDKEWVTIGHRFHIRVGHQSLDFFEDQRGPIFLQFLDCVFQIVSQYPNSFEFTEYLLVYIADALYSLRFGTFLGENVKEREQTLDAHKRTASIWTFILESLITVQSDMSSGNSSSSPKQFSPNNKDGITWDRFVSFSEAIGPHLVNEFYRPQQAPTVIIPNTSQSALRFWHSYFLRYCSSSQSGDMGGGESASEELAALRESIKKKQNINQKQQAKNTLAMDSSSTASGASGSSAERKPEKRTRIGRLLNPMNLFSSTQAMDIPGNGNVFSPSNSSNNNSPANNGGAGGGISSSGNLDSTNGDDDDDDDQDEGEEDE